MPFDTMHACEEIAKIVDPERVMNIDQIIEKIRERFSEKMYHHDEIRVAMIEMLEGLPIQNKINMANSLVLVLEKNRDG